MDRLPSNTYQVVTGLTADPQEVGRDVFGSDTGWHIIGVEYYRQTKAIVFQYENDLATNSG